MNFLTSAHVHSLLYIHEGPPTKILEAWGGKPVTVVTPENSREFQQELMRTDLNVLKEKYNRDHLLVLTDAAWVDYEPVFDRSLFMGARPKLLVLLSNIYDADLVPLVNLVRANDGLPLLFDHARIEVALRGHALWDRGQDEQRIYAAPLFNPFDPYPVYLKEDTAEFTKLVYAVRSPWETIATFFDFNGSMLFACSSEAKKKEVVRFLRCNGFTFTAKDPGLLKRNDTCVYVSNGSAQEWSSRQVHQLHVIDPPENLARTMAEAKSKSLTVYLYVPFSNPFEEPQELKAYRTTLGRCMRQRQWFEPKPELTLFDVVSGLFVHNPLWTRAALVAMVCHINPEMERAVLLEEMELIIENKMVLVDVFGREGYLVFCENMFIFQPFV
jgi:hypothetical protein